MSFSIVYLVKSVNISRRVSAFDGLYLAWSFLDFLPGIYIKFRNVVLSLFESELLFQFKIWSTPYDLHAWHELKAKKVTAKNSSTNNNKMKLFNFRTIWP